MNRPTLALLFALATTLGHADKLDQFFGIQPLRKIIYQTCMETGVPLWIAAGLQVSEWKPGEPQTGPGWGWWQLNVNYHEWFSQTFYGGRDFDEFDPVASTQIAIRYLAWLHDLDGTWWKALVDYKHGQNANKPASTAIVTLCKLIANGGLQ